MEKVQEDQIDIIWFTNDHGNPLIETAASGQKAAGWVFESAIEEFLCKVCSFED